MNHDYRDDHGYHESQARLKNFYDFFAQRNFENSRRFNLKHVYDPEPLKKFLEKLGNPQCNYKAIHIAGTVGKGSTATYLARALSRDFRTGLYTSPHLESLYERIRFSQDAGNTVNHQPEFADVLPGILPNEFFAIWDNMEKNELVHSISFFDALTAIAMTYFHLKKAEWAVFETGLGGRLDSTNNLKAEICVLTPIDLDHQSILGDTIDKIAQEKAGIIKPASQVYTHVQSPQALEVIENTARQKKANLKIFKAPQNKTYLEQNHAFARWIYEDYFEKPFPVIETKIKARMEVIMENPLVLFDSAHNVRSLKEILETVCSKGGRWNIYINTMKERSLLDMLEQVEIYKRKESNFQVEVYLFPMEDDLFYQEQDFLANSNLKIISEEQIRQKIKDEKFDKFQKEENMNHLFAGSMRLYPQVKKLMNISELKLTGSG